MYWIDYAFSSHTDSYAWRVPVILQCIFLIPMLFLLFILPESPSQSYALSDIFNLIIKQDGSRPTTDRMNVSLSSNASNAMKITSRSSNFMARFSRLSPTKLRSVLEHGRTCSKTITSSHNEDCSSPVVFRACNSLVASTPSFTTVAPCSKRVSALMPICPA